MTGGADNVPRTAGNAESDGAAAMSDGANGASRTAGMAQSDGANGAAAGHRGDTGDDPTHDRGGTGDDPSHGHSGAGDDPTHDRGGAGDDPSHGHSGAGDDPAGARLLFRYLGGEEWYEYRAILGVFAGTFFAEFTPEDVAATIAAGGTAGIDPAVVPDRLESLRRWGNLTVSSSVGNPSSLDDYYRRRNRYLITRAGQEVYELVEQVLAGADEIGDVQAGRLRDLHRALEALREHGEAGFDRAGGEDLADAVRTVFDIHQRFTTELTQFFAELNEWQSRYDLNADEVRFFAGVLVDYVSEQLTEIERMARPIARSLERILPQLPVLLSALRSGLAARVDDAGLADSVTVRRPPGTSPDDWEHLAAWFVAQPGRAPRLDQLTRQAVAAVRTLTANLTRLSRGGLGAASRRADFVRLAGFFDRTATADDAHEIAAATFGLGSCRRLGTLAADADDPAPTVTPWKEAPRAVVAVSLRERGETTQRGRATPMPDRRLERKLMQRRREMDRLAHETVAAELLSCAGDGGRIDGASMSVASFAMLRDLISRSGLRVALDAEVRTATAAGVRCDVHRKDGARTVVECPDGRLAMQGLVVTIKAAPGTGRSAELAIRATPGLAEPVGAPA